jgi:hypothetical protein
MSTETDPKPEPSLDESVETLLSEMSQTVERLGSHLDGQPHAVESPSDQAGGTAPPDETLQDLAAAVDEMVREVASAVSPLPAQAVADSEPQVAASIERAESDHAVESLAEVAPAEIVSAEVVSDDVAEQPVAAAGFPLEQATSQAGASTEREAADAFASLSEELLAGLDQVEAPEINVMASVVASKSQAMPEKPPAEPATEDAFASLTDELLNGLGEVPNPPEPEAVVVPEVVPAVAEVPVLASVVAPVVAHALAPAPAKEEPPHTTTTARRVLHAAGHVGLEVAQKLEPHALRAAAAISAPLNSKPRALRDTIGWLGVYTLFVGLTLGVYVRFIHEAPSPAPAHPGVKLADRNDRKGAAGEVVRSDTHGSDAHGGEHGAASDAGGHGAAKDDAHGTKKDDGHGAKKDDGHGGAAKAGGKATNAPKLPVPAFKPGPEKPGAKKEAKKKDDGHGGGH